MEIITRKTGIWLMGIGLVMQLLNYITYTYWQIDIDILGFLVFVVGLIVMIVGWKK